MNPPPAPASPSIHKMNPATGEPLATYAAATPTDISEAVNQARTAQRQWQQASLQERARVLEAIMGRIYRESQRLAEIISQETGKPLADALEADIGTALSSLRYYADIGPKRLRPRPLANDIISLITGRLHRETYHPRGVIAIISPWNYPLAIPASGISTALMAGNAVVLKPSELTPGTGAALVEIFRETLQANGFSPHLVGLLQGDGSTGATLLEQPIDGVIFTGSERVGQRIRKQAAERGLWTSLELGGSDAMLVLPGCDLDKAASYALWGRYTNAGQACAGVKRIFIPAGDESKFLNLLQAKVKALKVGGPENPEHHVGPLISEAQLQLLEGQVQDAIQRGAKVWAGGQRVPRPGWFYEPTLLSEVPSESRILQEEVFGPVLPVIPYRNEAEAVDGINASAYGLTASVFGPVSYAESVAARLECGTVVINDVGPSNYAMLCAPWGGWKASGTGVSHGERALLELCRVKVVSINHLYGMPLLGKPMWLFGQESRHLPARSRTVLAFASRHASMWNPLRWLPFWQNRENTRI
jgi:acyl-CoA reductase-like NAD-dependent aldehyde dehydrogenase